MAKKSDKKLAKQEAKEARRAEKAKRRIHLRGVVRVLVYSMLVSVIVRFGFRLPTPNISPKGNPAA